MIKLNKILITAGALMVGMYSSVAFAQQTLPSSCPGYVLPKTKLLSERGGKRLQKAYDVYLNEELSEDERTKQALVMLGEIEAKEPYDIAYIEYFRGQLMVQQDGRAKEALVLLQSAAERNILNDKDQAALIKLVADLSIQEEKYDNSIKFYNKWMKFTCNEDGDVYTRMAKAHTEMKEYDKVHETADLAIATYEEPNKNPYALKINAYVETKNFDGAVRMGEILVELFPTEKNWWSSLGFFYMMVEDYPKALATLALTYKQGYFSKKSEYRALVQLYSSNGMPHRSAELQLKYMKEGILDAGAEDYAGLGNSMQLARDYKDAAKQYGQAASLSDDPEHFRKQGVLLLTAEDYKGAITALTKALENDVDSPGKVHFSLMEAYFYAGNYRQANVHAIEARKEPTLRRNANAWMPYIKQKAENRGIKI